MIRVFLPVIAFGGPFFAQARESFLNELGGPVWCRVSENRTGIPLLVLHGGRAIGTADGSGALARGALPIRPSTTLARSAMFQNQHRWFYAVEGLLRVG